MGYFDRIELDLRPTWARDQQQRLEEMNGIGPHGPYVRPFNDQIEYRQTKFRNMLADMADANKRFR